jgi:DNA-binding transcriptional LysR family regulator
MLPEAFLTLMRADHPLAGSELTLERFLSVPHLLHSPNGSREGRVDEVLREKGMTRRLGAVVAHLSAVPQILARTDMIMTLSSRLAHQLVEGHRLVIRELPIEVTHTRLSMVFHRRFEADPGHAWLRRMLIAEAREA